MKNLIIAVKQGESRVQVTKLTQLGYRIVYTMYKNDTTIIALTKQPKYQRVA